MGDRPPADHGVALFTAVLAGGIVGTLLRYSVAEGLPVTAGELPWATLAVNITGAIAFVVVAAMVRRPAPRAFLGTGVLGAFTTMSAFGVETAQLVDEAPAMAGRYVVLTVVLGLGGALAAAAVVRRVRVRAGT